MQAEIAEYRISSGIIKRTLMRSVSKIVDLKNNGEKGSVRRTGDLISIPGDYQYRALCEGLRAQRFWHYNKLSEAVRWLTPEKGDIVLDAGCGSGVLAAQLAEYPATEVIGIDSNPSAISFATCHFCRPNLQFRLGTVDDTNFLKESFTKIALLEVIEHIPREDILKVLLHLNMILRDNGRLVISTPNSDSLWPLIELIVDRTNLVPRMKSDQHVAFYNLQSLGKLAEEAGFKMVTYRSINLFSPWLAMLSWRLALGARRLEHARRHTFGAILVVVLEKQSKNLG
jgi:2-polyprenyl-3-methyl-5-hydroxy-6-metoxy-1,4-benzoquinol methylase